MQVNSEKILKMIINQYWELTVWWWRRQKKKQFCIFNEQNQVCLNDTPHTCVFIFARAHALKHCFDEVYPTTTKNFQTTTWTHNSKYYILQEAIIENNHHFLNAYLWRSRWCSRRYCINSLIKLVVLFVNSPFTFLSQLSVTAVWLNKLIDWTIAQRLLLRYKWQKLVFCTDFLELKQSQAPSFCAKPLDNK